MDIKKLNEDQILDLNEILKIIIPSDQKKGLPGADEIKFIEGIITLSFFFKFMDRNDK